MRPRILPPLVLAVLVLAACAGSDGETVMRTESAVSVRGDEGLFARADTVFRLPGALREISGLTWIAPGQLGAVQDEEGLIFLISPSSGEVQREIRFSSNRDYEGIALRDSVVFVLESDGDLYQIENWWTEDVQTSRIETPLRRSNDTEGLAVDPLSGRLWIVCKEASGTNREDVRTVFSFDPDAEQLSETPVLELSPPSMPREDAVSRLARRLARMDGDISRFKPSALAFHPATGHVYLLNSVEPSVIVADREGDLLAVYALDDRLLQPEGLAISPRGDFYIASEGQGGRGRLAVFSAPTAQP